MSRAEGSRRFVPEPLDKHLPPLRARNFDVFVDLLESQCATAVQAETSYKSKPKWGFGDIEFIGIHKLVFTSQTSSGRKIKYVEKINTSDGIDPKHPNKDDYKYSFSGATSAELRLREIEMRLPNVELHGPVEEMGEIEQLVLRDGLISGKVTSLRSETAGK